jgi:hypothetical protein
MAPTVQQDSQIQSFGEPMLKLHWTLSPRL